MKLPTSLLSVQPYDLSEVTDTKRKPRRMGSCVGKLQLRRCGKEIQLIPGINRIRCCVPLHVYLPPIMAHPRGGPTTRWVVLAIFLLIFFYVWRQPQRHVAPSVTQSTQEYSAGFVPRKLYEVESGKHSDTIAALLEASEPSNKTE